MLRVVSLFIILCLSISLFSCNEIKSSETLPSVETSEETDLLNDWPESKWVWVKKPIDVEFPFELDSQGRCSIPEGYTTIDNIWVYQEFLRRAILPDNFVSAENLTPLGKFKSFSVYNTSEDYWYSYWLEYTFLSGGTQSVSITVNQRGDMLDSYVFMPPKNEPPDDIFKGYFYQKNNKGISASPMASTSVIPIYEPIIPREYWVYDVYVKDGIAYCYKDCIYEGIDNDNEDLDKIGVKIDGTHIFISIPTSWTTLGNTDWKKDLVFHPEYFLRYVGKIDKSW